MQCLPHATRTPSGDSKASPFITTPPPSPCASALSPTAHLPHHCSGTFSKPPLNNLCVTACTQVPRHPSKSSAPLVSSPVTPYGNSGPPPRGHHTAQCWASQSRPLLEPQHKHHSPSGPSTSTTASVVNCPVTLGAAAVHIYLTVYCAAGTTSCSSLHPNSTSHCGLHCHIPSHGLSPCKPTCSKAAHTCVPCPQI